MQPHHTIEEWRDIPGYEGLYQVSDFGRVRSVGRNITYTNRWGTETTYHKPGRILSPGVDGAGYLFVQLGRDSGPKEVHMLVALVFYGERPPKHDIHHKDRNKHHNSAGNLVYKESFRHMSEHRTGNIPGNTKLSPERVDEIRILIDAKQISQAAIARRYGVTPGLITMIKKGQRWNR